MSDTELPTNGRVPTLVQLCQRVASSCVDSIVTLGDDLSYPLVRPILERCSSEQLLQLEGTSPHLQHDTLEIWMHLCIRKYPTAVEKYLDDDSLEPTSWRERYMALKHEEKRRFERLGSKLKAQRMEVEERKKEREVKLIDRVPPSKRPRTGGWGAPVQPKTLLQKTLSEASKIQKTMYTSRMIPPMNSSKSYRVLPRPSCPIIPPSTSTTAGRVSVNTVPKRPISGPSGLSSKISPRAPLPSSSVCQPSPSTSSLSNSRPIPTSVIPQTATTTVPQSGTAPVKKPSAASPSSTPADARPIKAIPIKKDPMATLFVPKHRAYSQRPVTQRPV
ncbi:hypothetical protein P691DRAFT_671037 [Macrolepiota fuliginosa MF-IS2]|uniref:Elongin-A n=1 Tax=Macrolepiota fuliginosa MF-IS2 TaxID=1400762 RepID=A0A9P6C1E2_9AGAR|nr:hypothetical protein P691DRAFT_671037 [Macrolepiota fuliginosa MF-IS2]